MPTKPKIGSSMYDSEGGGHSIVVADGTEPIDALLDLMRTCYGGEFSRTNPVLVEEAKGLKVEVWRSCTKAYREAEGIDSDYQDYWSPDGDGRRSIHVLYLARSVWVLGEMAEEAEGGEPDVMDQGASARKESE